MEKREKWVLKREQTQKGHRGLKKHGMSRTARNPGHWELGEMESWCER